MILGNFIKFGNYNRIITSATDVARSLNFDLSEVRKLCSQLKKYKDNEEPFNVPFSEEEGPISWWECMECSPNYIQTVAIYVLSICPNSASCERGFSTLGWLTGKRRLQLSVEHLESMMKLILYYRSNAPKELSFYGKTHTKKLSSSEIMEMVQLALAEPVDVDDDYDESVSRKKRTNTGETIPEDNVRVIIEPLWIENIINLNNERITANLGEVPLDDDDDGSEIGDLSPLNDDEQDIDPEKGITNFTADNLLAEFGE